jgi:hypothetical protein
LHKASNADSYENILELLRQNADIFEPSWKSAHYKADKFIFNTKKVNVYI